MPTTNFIDDGLITVWGAFKFELSWEASAYSCWYIGDSRSRNTMWQGFDGVFGVQVDLGFVLVDSHRLSCFSVAEKDLIFLETSSQHWICTWIMERIHGILMLRRTCSIMIHHPTPKFGLTSFLWSYFYLKAQWVGQIILVSPCPSSFSGVLGDVVRTSIMIIILVIRRWPTSIVIITIMLFKLVGELG